MELIGRTIRPGSAAGPLLIISQPLSFWGGVDPRTGRVVDPRHPNHGDDLAGRIVMMERTIGSSSSSAIMLELLRNDVAPAGLVLGKADAILVLGILVAEELGYPTVPVLEADDLDGWANGIPVHLRDDRLSESGTERLTAEPGPLD